MAKPLQVIVVGITLSKDTVLVPFPIFVRITRELSPLCLSILVLCCIKVTTPVEACLVPTVSLLNVTWTGRRLVGRTLCRHRT